MRVLITGNGGFIGSALCPVLEGEGHQIFGLRESLTPLQNHLAVQELVKQVQPQVVIHLAAKTEVALSFDNYLEVSEVNYVGTVNLAEACRRFVSDFRLFSMASTMETYGHQPHGTAFTEETVQRPAAPYAVAKLGCERYLQYLEYAYGFPSLILRQTNAYGRPDNDFFVVERIISQMLRGSVCNLGAPEPWRNFLFIDDLVELYRQVLREPRRVVGQTLVTGPDNALSIAALSALVAQLLGWQGQVNWDTVPRRPGEIFYLNSNPAKAKSLLGWEPKVGLEEGLRRTIEIWRRKLSDVQV
jgi:nucleoside-diphosphate-sugar epimerase